MYISKKRFILITFLFFLLPFSVHWKLLLLGTKTTGTVIGYKDHYGQISMENSRNYNHSLIQFKAHDTIIEYSTMEDIIYPIGKKLAIFYRSKSPEDFIVVSFSEMAMSRKMIIPWVLLIFWFGFYLSFNTKPRTKKSHIDLRILKNQLEKKKH